MHAQRMRTRWLCTTRSPLAASRKINSCSETCPRAAPAATTRYSGTDHATLIRRFRSSRRLRAERSHRSVTSSSSDGVSALQRWHQREKTMCLLPPSDGGPDRVHSVNNQHIRVLRLRHDGQLGLHVFVHLHVPRPNAPWANLASQWADPRARSLGEPFELESLQRRQDFNCNTAKAAGI